MPIVLSRIRSPPMLGASAHPKGEGGELQWLKLQLLAFQTRDSAQVSRRRIEAQKLLKAICRLALWLVRLLAITRKAIQLSIQMADNFILIL